MHFFAQRFGVKPNNRVLHSELELEILSRFSSQDEFLRVETRRVERHFFVTFKNFVKSLVPTHFLCFFAIFLQFFVKIRVGTSFCESGRVRKKLEQLIPTLIFEKRTFPKLAKTKISAKAVFRRALPNKRN